MGYLDHLAALRKRKGLSQAKLAEMIGVEQPTIQRWEKGNREPDFQALDSLAKALGVTAGSLLDGAVAATVGPQLWVKGEASAGAWLPAIEKPEDEWETFTGRAGVAAEMEHRFGLRLVGDSMNEVFPEGTIVECVSVFGHIEPAPGRRVVLVRQRDDGRYEATVKELVEMDGALWAVPRSTNPTHLAVNLSEPQDGIVETRIAAVVVSSIRPE